MPDARAPLMSAAFSVAEPRLDPRGRGSGWVPGYLTFFRFEGVPQKI
jgi:hypothetical protein